MLDDREYLLFKLLCRVSDKTSLTTTHGIIYAKANMHNGCAFQDLESRWNFSYLFDLVRRQLISSDLIIKLSDDTFAIILESTSEDRTLISAQLIKNGFQHLPMSNCCWNVSIGAALFDQASTSVPDLISTVSEYALQSRSENRIVYQNLTNESVIHQPTATKAA